MFLESPQNWKDYSLIDSGNFEKLERFGSYVLIRPEPKALWKPSLPEKEWLNMAHTKFTAGAGFGVGAGFCATTGSGCGTGLAAGAG